MSRKQKKDNVLRYLKKDPDFRKTAQIPKLSQNDYANDLRKTIRFRDREHQF